MELINWANSNGMTLKITKQEAETLIQALMKGVHTGEANIVFDTQELDIEVAQ